MKGKISQADLSYSLLQAIVEGLCLLSCERLEYLTDEWSVLSLGKHETKWYLVQTSTGRTFPLTESGLSFALRTPSTGIRESEFNERKARLEVLRAKSAELDAAIGKSR